MEGTGVRSARVNREVCILRRRERGKEKKRNVSIHYFLSRVVPLRTRKRNGEIILDPRRAMNHSLLSAIHIHTAFQRSRADNVSRWKRNVGLRNVYLWDIRLERLIPKRYACPRVVLLCETVSEKRDRWCDSEKIKSNRLAHLCSVSVYWNAIFCFHEFPLTPRPLIKGQ